MSELVVVEDAVERDRLVRSGLRTYDDFISLARRGERVSSSRSGETHRVTVGRGSDGVVCFIKCYDYTRRGRYRWRSEKGAAEARNYGLLRDRCGLNAPTVIARGVRTRGPWYRDSFLMTRAVEASQTFEAYAASADGRLDARVLAEAAAMVAKMHAAQFFHVDLQWRNILVSWHVEYASCAEKGRRPFAASEPRSDTPADLAHESGTTPCVLHILDCPRGGLRGNAVTQAHGRIRDLSSLHKDARRWLSAKAQLRWLKLYLGCDRLTPIDRAMIRTILRDRAIKDAPPTA